MSWLDLDGTANTRDLGGLPTRGGRRVRANVLLRSDNLQDLSAADVKTLLVDVGLSTVIDVRTDAERAGTGPSPLAGEAIEHVEISLIVEDAGIRADPGSVLPDRWSDGPVGAYLHYLEDTPGRAADAVRAIAQAERAALVHCAAGKDRTGTIVALALSAVGVPDEEIVADYALTNERIERIYERLLGSSTYAEDVARIGLDRHRVDPDSMAAVLDAVQVRYGGAASYLLDRGLAPADLHRLRDRLVD